MLGGLTMCEFSVDDEVDRTWCDDWNGSVGEWVQNETMNAHAVCTTFCSGRLSAPA